jgi:1,4-dihydroxy-2-naphthoate octaprenyltransferase
MPHAAVLVSTIRLADLCPTAGDTTPPGRAAWVTRALPLATNAAAALAVACAVLLGARASDGVVGRGAGALAVYLFAQALSASIARDLSRARRDRAAGTPTLPVALGRGATLGLLQILNAEALALALVAVACGALSPAFGLVATLVAFAAWRRLARCGAA